MKFLRKKKIILMPILVGVIVFVVGLMPLHKANAGWLGSLLGLDSITASVISFGVSVMGFLFGWIASVVFWLGGLLVEWALNINTMLLADTNVFLHTGWGVVLSFANLGFVLAIIIIAFATILRLESYAMKQVLWKLIVAALLVNFSLVIAGAFINVSDILSQYFLDGATNKGKGNFTVALTNALGAQNFLNIEAELKGIGEKSFEEKVVGGLNVFGAASLTFLASTFFIALFTLAGALVLLATAIMLIIRYVVLMVVLILSPLAWLCWILPATQKLWQKWWNEFLRWTFFAPIVLFFLYLVVTTQTKMADYVKTAAKNLEKDPTSTLGANPFTFGVENILNLVVMIGLMLGGLIVANSLSITGAKQAMGAAQGAGKAFGGYVGRRGTRTAGWLFRKQEKIDPITGLPIYQKGPRAAIQRKLKSWQTTGGRFKKGIAKQLTGLGEAYGKPGEPHKINKGLAASVWGGMKKGSGLFKGKEAKDWECQEPGCGNIVRATSKPKGGCKSCSTTTGWKAL